MVGLCRFKFCLRQDLIIRRDVEEILVHSGARDAVLHDGAALGSIGNDILEVITDQTVGNGGRLAVLGGAFAEGIDLPGERLHGAFIATLGLPQFNAEMEQMRTCIDKLMGAGTGYNYTYLYPGLQKVVQAAGRVIRTPVDRGVVVLLDDRYQRREVRALLPAWWRVGRISAEQEQEG